MHSDPRSVTDAPLSRRLFAEFLGSAFLAATVIGSGIAAAQLSPGDVGLQLFENAAATAAGLFTFILMFGPVSGAHFNPVVSLVDAVFGGLRRRHALAYIPAQVSGCIAGAVAANAMFGLRRDQHLDPPSRHPRAPLRRGDRHPRPAPGDLLAGAERRGALAPAAVGAYIGAAYFFTSSTSFANPAIDVGRMFSDTFAGIAPASVPAFVVFQLVGGALAIATIRALYPDITPEEASEIMLPHHEDRAEAPTTDAC